uniref:Uncharacterized protein n=1 Tax=Fagus sylvatica TaxID=28930 RepID=A0A2N9GY32_FAGSY
MKSVERAIGEHTTVGVVTSAARAVKTTPITITSSGGTAQGYPSESGSHADPSLLDSSLSTRHYVQRARRGSIVSTDSERTISATIRVLIPPSPLHESGGIAPTPVVIAAVVPAAVTVQDSEAVPAAAEEVPGVTQIEHAEVAASEDPVQANAILGSDVPARERAFAQDPVDDVSMEDMADTHDSYDAVLAETEDHVAGTQAADMEVTAPVTAHTSPTKTIASGNEVVAEEERRHQTAVVEFAIKGQPGLLFATSSRHVEYFWIFDDAKDDFEGPSATRGDSVLESLMGEVWQLLSISLSGRPWFKSRRILVELRVVEACAATLRDALNMVAPNPWDLASARGVSVESHAESALYGLLA